MGSSNNHKGWLRILSDIDFTVKNRIYRDDIVLNTTGPYMLSRLINQLRVNMVHLRFLLIWFLPSVRRIFKTIGKVLVLIYSMER